MCGITGCVSFDADLTAQRPVIQRMVDTMALRGPDDEGLWIDTHVALGHRRLAVIDIEGSRQPMATPDEQVVLTYSGEVYNFRELRRELEARGHRFRTRGDTEVVLHAYREWGDGLAERLNGMYAFALWDASRQSLILVRDRLGIKPLFYRPTPDGVIFGSEPKAILAHPDVEPEVDADGMRVLLGFTRRPGETVFKGMREVRPGEIVRVSRAGVSARKYWRLEAHDHPDDVPATVRHVRELLEDIVARQLISDVPLCALLSGGLDSSAMTALAQRALAAEGGGVRSFAVDFVGQSENFRVEELRDTPDAPFVTELAKHAGTDHSDIVLDNATLSDPANRAAVLRARDLPIGMGDMDTSLNLLFKEIKRHSTVALSGESADEVFGGYRWFHIPEAVNADTFPWMVRDMDAGPLPFAFVKGLMEELRMGEYLAQLYRDAVAEVPRLPGEEGHERRMREVCYLHLTRFLPQLLDRKDRMSMAVGLEVRVPFCDHRLVEYVFNAPWAMKTFDGREKSLLRAATSDVLPESIVQRRKAPYPATQDPQYDLALYEAARQMLDEPSTGVIDADAVRLRIAEPPGTRDPFERIGLESAILLHAWIRDYKVRLDL